MKKLAFVLAVVSLLALAQTTALSDQYQAHSSDLNYWIGGYRVIPFDFSQRFLTVSRLDLRLQAYVRPYVMLIQSTRWEDGQYVTYYIEHNMPSRLIASIADMEWYWDYNSPGTVTWEHSFETPTQSLQELLCDGSGTMALTLTWFYNEPGPIIINGEGPSMNLNDVLFSIDATPEPVCEPASVVALVSGFVGLAVTGRRRFWC